METQQTRELYYFGMFRLDAAERRLWCEDEPISLTPKEFDLLYYFVEHAGSVATKNDLLDTIWSDSFVEESTLARNISWLRKKLKKGAGGKRMIETVPKHGYRFTAEVTRSAEDENVIIVEEQTVQHFRGEEIITVDDAFAERRGEWEKRKRGETEMRRLEDVENKLSILPNVPASPRPRVPASAFLLIALVALVGIGFAVYRNQLQTNAEPTGLNVKATITIKNIMVDATRETVDTGLKVQPGDTIRVSAMGTLQPGNGQTWTFMGNDTDKVSVNHTFQKADPWSLVAWIGTETDKTDHFQVSKNHSVKADKSGFLYLAVNDLNNNYADNRGGITVAVVLFRTFSIYAEDNDLEAAWGTELVRIYKEDTLAIRGRGDVAYWEGGELYDLDGSDHDTFGYLAPEINARSLIGKIGSRTPFKIGMNYPPQKVDVNGGLFISVNDEIMKPGAFKNNSSELTVDIEVVRQTEAFKNPI